MKNRILVTGASGFIGKRLVRHLVALGENVTCLVRKTSDVSELKKLRCEIVTVDLFGDAESIKAAVNGFDTVYHLAAVTRAIRSRDLIEVNKSVIRKLLDGCVASETTPTFVNVSSVAAVGPSQRSQPHLESMTENPVSNYGKSKLACEQLAMEYASRIPISIVRPPIVLGQGDRRGLRLFQTIDQLGWHLVPTFSSYEFSVIHVDDLVSALVAVGNNGKRIAKTSERGEGVYFASADETLTFSELGRLIGRCLGREWTRVLRIATPLIFGFCVFNELKARIFRRPEYLNFDKYLEGTAGNWACSNFKIKNETGFAPATSFEERLEQTISWYRHHGWLKPEEPKHQTAPNSSTRQAT